LIYAKFINDRLRICVYVVNNLEIWPTNLEEGHIRTHINVNPRLNKRQSSHKMHVLFRSNGAPLSLRIRCSSWLRKMFFPSNEEYELEVSDSSQRVEESVWFWEGRCEWVSSNDEQRDLFARQCYLLFIPVTGRGGSQGCVVLRISHFLGNQTSDGG
jgi:hypothetical protein